jgi:hypothetical protein
MSLIDCLIISMALIGPEIAVIDRNMIDNKKIEKRTEYNYTGMFLGFKQDYRDHS